MKDFEKVCRECYPTVYRFLLSLCGDEDLAEEITAETFYQAYLHIDKFRGDCKTETWLCRIAKNTLYKETRRKKRNIPLEEMREQTVDVGVLDRLGDRQQAQEVHRRLHELSEPYRDVFMLRVFGELSFRQIGDIFKKTESWAKVTYYRAKSKLVEAMEEK